MSLNAWLVASLRGSGYVQQQQARHSYGGHVFLLHKLQVEQHQIQDLNVPLTLNLGDGRQGESQHLHLMIVVTNNNTKGLGTVMDRQHGTVYVPLQRDDNPQGPVARQCHGQQHAGPGWAQEQRVVASLCPQQQVRLGSVEQADHHHHLHRRVDYHIQASTKSNLKAISQLNSLEVGEPSLIDNEALVILNVWGRNLVYREVVFHNNKLFDKAMVTGK